LNHLALVFFALVATAATPSGTLCPCHSPGSGPLTCWHSIIVPLSYSHNTGVNGPEEFKLIVQQATPTMDTSPAAKSVRRLLGFV